MKLVSSWRHAAVCGVCAVVVFASPAAGQETDITGQPIISEAVTVADAVDIALKNSPTIAARGAAIAAATARVGMTRAMTRPRVSTTTSGTVGSMGMILPGPENVEPRNFSTAPNKARLNQNLMGMYPLYTGGALKGRVNGARALQEASASEAANSELDVALAVKNAYYLALYQQHVVAAYQRRVEESTERVRIAREAFNEGKIAKFDLLRNQTELAEAEQELNNARRDEAAALIDLKNAMGISQSSQLTLSDTLIFQQISPNLEEAMAMAAATRPEIAAARARVRSAEATLGVARSAYKPQVYGMAMADAAAMRGEGTDSGYLIGITVALPVLDGGLRKSSANEANAMLDQMRADEREVVLMVNRDVASSLNQLDAASKNVTLSEAAVSQADEDYRVIRLRYEAGKATNVEVLDALASLTRAQTNRAGALYNYNVARETLTRATGRR